MLKFKYYGHHVMSRKFKYRYIKIIKVLPKVQISSDTRESQRSPKENQKGSPNGSKEPPLTKGTSGDLCSPPLAWLSVVVAHLGDDPPVKEENR
jgi:hypothetical protein